MGLRPPAFPILDDHIHIDPWNGRGIEAAKEFRRAGGTHMILVSKPSWSYGICPSRGADFEEVFMKTLTTAREVESTGIRAFAILGVHPAEITRLTGRMTLEEAVAIMIDALGRAALHVREGRAIGLKSGRPHYRADEEVMRASNRVLMEALLLARECGCALQIHAESGPCADIAEMARTAGIPLQRVVKHFAIPETPLTPSLIARHEGIPLLCRSGRGFTMESDYMDENSRPGAVMGPKAVPRNTLRLFYAGEITEEDVHRIHVETPSLVYGIEISI